MRIRTVYLLSFIAVIHLACSDEAAEPSIPSPDVAVADTSGTTEEDAGTPTPDTGNPEPDTTPKPVICSEGQPCNDGDFCTKNDICTAGVCAGEPYSCADDLEYARHLRRQRRLQCLA